VRWQATAQRLLRLVGLAAVTVILACGTTPEPWVPIPPAEFHFYPVVLRGEPGPGGWKAAQLLITLARLEGRIFKPVVCPVRVEVPEMTWRGAVTDEFAQQSAAKASDLAAERVLRQNLLSAEMCRRFYMEMEKELKEFIPGARVKRF
jgi:hypothetical protein